MSKPYNRNQIKKRYTIMAIGVYILVVLFFCHWGYLVALEPDATPGKLLLPAVEHMLSNPFRFFPVQLQYLGMGLFLGLLAPLIIQTEYMRNRDLRPSEESGSAKWNYNLKAYNKAYVDTPLQGSGSPNMIMTRDIFLSMDTRKTLRNDNVVVFGGSGAGKSYRFVKPNILQANCSFVVTDPSGELLESTGTFLEKEGYEIRVFNLVDMTHSDTYNPFRYVRDQEGVLVMLNALMKNTNGDSKASDPFWEKAEMALLESICFYVLELPLEYHNFSTVLALLRKAQAQEGQKSPLDTMFEDFAKDHPNHIATNSYAVYKSAGGGKTAQSILVSCQTRLHTFNLEAIQNLTNTDSIDLGSIGDKKVALFCITPTAEDTYNYLVAMMYTQLFETLYHHAETECEGKRLKYHVRFLLDEFANIGTIPNFCQRLATMRKYEISCTIILQALSQLKALYKDNWDVLIANCDSLLFLGASDSTTLEYISKMLGKETIRSINSSRSFGRTGGSSMSYNKTGRDLMTPDELRTMPNANCIYFLRGIEPFFSTKYSLEKHPNYSQCSHGGGKPYDVTAKKYTKRWR